VNIVVLCTQPVVLCTQPVVLCTQPVVLCTQPVVLCTQPVVLCTQPVVLCTQPVVLCTQPVVLCTQPVVLCTQPVVLCTQPVVLCTQPVVLCTQPVVLCTQPEQVVYITDFSTPPPPLSCGEGKVKFVDSSIALQEMIVDSISVSSKPQIPILQVQDEASDSDMDTGPFFSSGPFSYSQMTAKRPIKKKILTQSRPEQTTTPIDPKVKRFHDAIKSAEKSSLVFNLDMGGTKLLNEKSILSRATLALTAKAAIVEGKPANKPSQDTIDALDDVLSIAEGATLFGKQTKVFRNSNKADDPRNGTFFTVPVRYEFKDKDQKLAAESVLRERCKAECTTPYPTIVRHCIKQVIDHFRSCYQEDYIKVQVDPSNFCLKVSRRSKKDGWFKYDDPIPLPEEAYNTTARSVPEGFVIQNLPVLIRRENASAESSG
jgi:hypothetical protein